MRRRRENVELIQAVELIEVFAPDDPLAWEHSASDAPRAIPFDGGQQAARSQSTHRAAVIAAVVTALVVAVAVASSGDDERSHDPTTTTVSPTSTTGRALLDPLVESADHFLIEDPSLTPYSADIVARPSERARFIAYTSAEREGPVVTIQFHTHPYEAYGTLRATRSVVNGVELVSPINHPTTYAAEVAIDDHVSATLRASGLPDVDVALLANGIAEAGGLTAETEDTLRRSFGLGLAFQSLTTNDWMFGLVESSVRYLTDDGRVIALYSAPDGDQDLGKHGHRLFALQSLATEIQYSTDGRAYGHLIDGGDAIVVWVDDSGRLLSLVGPGDPADLAELSRHARPATADEWTGMLYGLRPDYRLGDFATLDTGVSADGEPWHAGPQLVERAGRTEFLWWWTVPGEADSAASTAASAAVGTRPNVDTLVVPGATFVFVTHPSAGGTVTVRTGTGTTYVADLLRPYVSSPVNMAVVYVVEPGPVTVDIDGVPVAP